ncbi:MAG: hypothetical protein RI554_07960 [Trueperaceae bacterium]|nr:hypothetical protein [Trueperaceae bacterium]
MSVTWLALVGPFHRRFPRYNAVTVRETVAALAPARIVTTAVPPGGFEDDGWRDVEEPALAEVVAWARARGVPVEAVGEPSPDPSAQEDFARYLTDAAVRDDAVARVGEAEAALEALLARAHDADGVHAELAPAVAALHEARLAAFGDGPGTDWLEARGATMAERIAGHLDGAADGVVLAVPADHGPGLRAALAERGVTPANPPVVPPSDAARTRALLDVALSGDGDDPGAMLEALAPLPMPEARLAEAEVLLRAGDPGAALARLREAATTDFVDPPWLPGWLLARLGQLADVADARDEARRAYRGVLALAWAPRAAREAAKAGLETPFTLPRADGDAGA